MRRASPNRIFYTRNFYREPPLAVGCDSTAACFRLVEGCNAAFACGIDAATRRCSSAVNWKM